MQTSLIFALCAALASAKPSKLDHTLYLKKQQRAYWNVIGDLPFKWTPQDKQNADEASPYYQGDIRGPRPLSKNGRVDDRFRWPGGVVPYEIAPGDFGNHLRKFHLIFIVYEFPILDGPTETIIRQAFADYESVTNGCIIWREKTDDDTAFVHFQSSESGCYSYVGRIGLQQPINYAPGCTDRYGTVQHEMYHALGFFHEQSRTDRDDFVTINFENVEPGNYLFMTKDIFDPITVIP